MPREYFDGDLLTQDETYEQKPERSLAASGAEVGVGAGVGEGRSGGESGSVGGIQTVESAPQPSTSGPIVVSMPVEPPIRTRRLTIDRAVRLIFLIVCLAYAAGFFLFPTYPTYDSYYGLLWGRELLHLQIPSFTEFRAPTEHPLNVFIGAVLALLGSVGDRAWIAVCLASWLAAVWGIYRLGKISFTPLVGAIAAALMLTRLDFANLALRGYIDIPYVALVIWAFVLETQRRKVAGQGARGSGGGAEGAPTVGVADHSKLNSEPGPGPGPDPNRGAIPVLLLLAAAGLLRPEAWLMAGMYFLWISWKASWRKRLLFAALTAIGPVVWAGLDFVATGDPMFSFHHTSGLAASLGRQGGLDVLRYSLPVFLIKLVKWPVLAAGGLGMLLAILLVPRRVVMPLIFFVTGISTFLFLGLAGSSVIPRYLMVAAIALLPFAAFLFGGFSVVRRKTWLRRIWVGVSLSATLGALVFTATHLSIDTIGAELSFRGDGHSTLVSVLKSPTIKEGMRCGPLTVPNHKMVPDVRWIMNLGPRQVVPRAHPGAGGLPTRGAAIYVNSRFALLRQSLTDDSDPLDIQIPPPGFRRAFISEPYTVYVGC